MTVTAFSGPIVQFGATLSSTSGDGITGQDYEHNPQRAPTYADLGDSLLDPRSAYNYDPGGTNTAPIFGFFNNTGNVDYIPTTASTIALVQNTASSGVSTFTLAAASSANGTYSTTIVAPETGKVTGTLIAIDSTAAYLTFVSSNNPFVLWNPGAGTGRCVSITTSSSGDLGTWSIAGRDMYGYKMTETIALSQGTSQSSGYFIVGQKAFKYISAITNTTTPTSTGITIGISTAYGAPLVVPYAGQNIQLSVVPTAQGSSVSLTGLSSANFILASTAATQTSTTPDVRGIYKSTTAANNTVRLQITVTPSASAIATITSTNFSGLFGGTQFSSV